MINIFGSCVGQRPHKSFLLFLFFIVVIASCRTISPVVENDGIFSGDDIYANLVDKSPDVSTYSVRRMNVKIIENDEEMNLRGSVRISRDSAILVSINAFAGIEAARILLTPDSVKILDRINRSYFAGDYLEAEKFLPVRINYDIVQGIFFGSSVKLLNEFDLPDRSKTGYSFEDNSMTLRYTGNIFKFNEVSFDDDVLQILFDNHFLTRDVEVFSADKNVYSKLSFNSFAYMDDQYFPDDIDFYFVSHSIPLHANFRLSRIEINQEINFPFSIPSAYKSY
ncbi:MAG: DUF4292 domain-containing protein [Cyclobacteriaceae bacterium]